ncbi:hypothetical protein OIU84_022626 [Salix udensis]|uniref:Uncharacterized protein n=1 Tax=Salix udensis TaxID=889485 RepID=A0AAD6PFX5_9ROSI|nr:hypothetical protein OIU84_022626 [Salix udensis]
MHQEALNTKQSRRSRGDKGRRHILSSGFAPHLDPSIHEKQQQIQRKTQSQSNPRNQPLLEIQIPPPTSPNPPLLTHQRCFQSYHEQEQTLFSNPSTTQQTLISTPHKRLTIMAQSPPSSISHSPTLSSLHSIPNQSIFHKKTILNTITIPLTTKLSIKTLAHKVLFHFSHARLLCAHLTALILIVLPSFYFFLSNPHRLFIINLLFILAFSITLLACLNLVLPRLPSLRLLVARSLPNKFKSTSLPIKSKAPVVWSIGSKPKIQNKPYSGSWVQGYSNGDVYEGEFHKGKCSGSGVYYYYMSGRYEGDWVDEKYDGYGVETWAKGSRYRGQYRQGLRHGIGVYRFYTGDVYAGEWCNGQCHGCGIHTCEDGSKYVGEFKWGVKHGLGHYHFRNGDTYAGEYFADKMHGFGVYQFGNGHRYEGAWHEGRRQGLGVYTFRNGETHSGHWQNGILDVSTVENGNPESPNAISHPKAFNAVQEAKRAAEKAFDVARIEERVNKTIASANKAANAARVAAVKAVQRQMHHQNNDYVVGTCLEPQFSHLKSWLIEEQDGDTLTSLSSWYLRGTTFSMWKL